MGVVQFAEGKLVPISEIRLTAQYLDVPPFNLTAENLRLQLPCEDFASILSGEWPRLNLAAKQLNLQNFELVTPILRIDSKAYPLISFQGAANSLKGAIDLNGQLNAKTWSAQVHALGCLDLIKLIPEEFTEKIPKIVPETLPYYELKLDFEDGFDLKHTDLTAQFESLRVNELTFDHVNAHASYANGLFVIEDLYFRRQQQWLDLTFCLDTRSFDYHGSLIGRLFLTSITRFFLTGGQLPLRMSISALDYNLSDFTIR